MVDISDIQSSKAWENILDDSNSLTWVVVGPADGKKNKVVVHASGSGGLDEVQAALDDTKVRRKGNRCEHGSSNTQIKIHPRAKWLTGRCVAFVGCSCVAYGAGPIWWIPCDCH